MNRLLFILFLVLAAASCQKGTCIHTYQSVPHSQWSIRDTLTFHIPPLSQDGEYELLAGIRIQRNFPFNQVWVVVEQNFYSPMLQHKDTLCIQIADSTGCLLGTGLNLCQYEEPLPPISLHKGQEGTLRLYHIMSKEILPHVHDVGLHVRQKGQE